MNVWKSNILKSQRNSLGVSMNLNRLSESLVRTTVDISLVRSITLLLSLLPVRVTSKMRRRCIAKYRRRCCAVCCSVKFVSVGVSLSCQCRCVNSLGVYELAENEMLWYVTNFGTMFLFSFNKLSTKWIPTVYLTAIVNKGSR